MASRVETLTYGDFLAPAGTVVTTIVCLFSEAAGAHVGQTVPAGTTTIRQDLDAGTWTFTAQALDQGGKLVGPPASDGPFTVQASTVTVSIPVTAVGMLEG
jgi:hypothetical protein